MRDFTLKVYEEILRSAKACDYNFITFEEYILKPLESKRNIIMRHDIDRIPKKACEMAKIEYDNAIRTSYYFRLKGITSNINVIKEIVNMGHEIGYHYEDLSLSKGNYAKAFHDRGTAKRMLGDYQGAIYDYRLAITYNPDLIMAYNNMGLVKKKLGAKAPFLVLLISICSYVHMISLIQSALELSFLRRQE